MEKSAEAKWLSERNWHVTHGYVESNGAHVIQFFKDNVNVIELQKVVGKPKVNFLTTKGLPENVEVSFTTAELEHFVTIIIPKMYKDFLE